MQPQGGLKAAACRLLLLILGFLPGSPVGSGVCAYKLPAKGAYFLPPPLQWREGGPLAFQTVRGRGALRAASRGLHAFAPAASNGSEAESYEVAVHKGEENVKEQQGSNDHRKLGTTMDLFCFPKPKVGAMGGLGPAFLPRGLCSMLQLQQALRNIQEEQGFEEVRTGSFAQAHLWHRSGHMQHFADNMFEIADPRERGSNALLEKAHSVELPDQGEFPPPSANEAGASYLLKPMSCPLHLSYFFDRYVRLGSALPVRISEFGHVYRREVPSALCGLMRMREFTQDDGHILCRISQALPEVTAFLSACQKLYKAVGFCKADIAYHLSTSANGKAVVHSVMFSSDPKVARAQNRNGPVPKDHGPGLQGLLRSALEELEISFTVASGEGAFYGPKIDIHLPDVEGRQWQTGTLQVDMFSPKNFGLEHTPDSNDRMCLLHRAMCGSLERFFGLVLEHLEGHLPSWLAPTQVAVLSVGEGQADAAEALSRRLRRTKVRVSLDTRPVHISRKLKLHIKYRTPEIWLLGTTDQERNTVTVRRPHGKQFVVPIERALAAARRRAKLPF